jgi:hypothetical protein
LERQQLTDALGYWFRSQDVGPVDAITGMSMAIGSYLANMPNKDNQGKSFVLVCKMIAKSVHEERLRTLP